MSEGSLDLRDALPVGTVVGGYEVEALLGHGGYSVVYRAHHTELGHVVALKEYLPADLSVRDGATVFPRSADCLDHYEDGKRRFLEEAKRIIQFKDDPGVVAFLDFFRANGTAYLAMEHVDGISLAELLRQRESVGRPFDETELRFLVTPLLMTLSRLHKADVLHRDIKPSNILVRRSDGKPVLIDFGAAKQQATLHSKSLAPFTEGYAALEQVGDGDLGPWTDVYAIGAVMWRVVAGGQPPWSPPNPVKAELRARAALVEQSDPMPSADDLGRGRFSLEILNLIDRCLALNSASRPRDSSELLTAMRSIESDTDDISESAENPPLRSATIPQPVRRLNVRVLGLGLALAMLAAFGYLLLRGIEPTIDRNRSVEAGSPESAAWLRKAAERGNVEAQSQLGSMYADGEGVEKDLAQAAAWFRRAAEQGYAEAQSELGGMYIHGNGVEKDPAHGAAWLRKAAEQGHTEAQGSLGGLYLDGLGVERDRAEAAVWIRRAAEQGWAVAQTQLGHMYLFGNGVEKDPANAAAWIRRAAEQGHAEAQLWMGVLFTRERVLCRILVKQYRGMRRRLSKEIPKHNGGCPRCIRVVRLAE